MDIQYRSTRSGMQPITASQAILKGLSDDGGLFVPTEIPGFTKSLAQMAEMDYRGLAYEIMSKFLTDFTEEELKGCISAAYDDKFDTPLIAPLKEADGVWYLELYHGATIAFKDMALSILPHLLTTAAKKNRVHEEIVILTATSGDTGKAAMAGFCDVPGTKIIVFYPKDGVSRFQERQMVTQKGENTYVAAIHGNFDDAQNRVKQIFNDAELRETLLKAGYRFSSANSINVGRLVPQIVYYVYAYCQLLQKGVIRDGDEINVTVPTGNFGNILAAYYAYLMGLPVKTLICASNENKVLFDFFQSGLYDRKRDFVLTTSPSMDILISSNLERLIYRVCDNDPAATAEKMRELSESGEYTIDDKMREKLGLFRGGFATEEENFAGIRELYQKTGYVIDTHTGIANCVCRSYREKTGDTAPMVVASTASPYKFAQSVLDAIDPGNGLTGDFERIDRLTELTGIPQPKAVRELRDAEVRHHTVVDANGMKDAVLRFLGIQ